MEDTILNFTSVDDIMTTYVTARRPHAGYRDSPVFLLPSWNIFFSLSPSIEYFFSLSIEYIFSQSIEYFMVDWWVDLWAVIHGQPTVILLMGTARHPSR